MAVIDGFLCFKGHGKMSFGSSRHNYMIETWNIAPVKTVFKCCVDAQDFTCH
jgi:hypothetical protein